MKSPEPSSTSLPLDYITELAMEMHLMRGECCQAAHQLATLQPPDLAALEECALLEEALARSHRLLQSTIKKIKRSQARRRKWKW